MKKVGKTSRPFRYDLNQIPYDYIMEVTNRFKGLDLVERVLKELWMKIHNTLQEAVIKTISIKKKCKKTNQKTCLKQKGMVTSRHLPWSNKVTGALPSVSCGPFF